MTTRNLYGRALQGDGTPYADAVIAFHLRQGSYTASAVYPPSTLTTTTDENGDFDLDLWTNADGTTPTEWMVVMPGKEAYRFVLEAGETAISLPALLNAQEVGSGWSQADLNTAMDVFRAEFGEPQAANGYPTGVEQFRYVDGDEQSDTATFLDALTGVEDGGVLYFQSNRTYDLSDLAEFPQLASNMTIEGNGATLDMRDMAANVYTFYAEGTVGSNLTPRGDLDYGDEWIELPVGSVVVGDMIEIVSLGTDVNVQGRKYMTMEDLQTPNIGQANMVTKVEETDDENPSWEKVWLDGLIYGDITTGQRFPPYYVVHYDNPVYTLLPTAHDEGLGTNTTITFAAGDYIYVGQRMPFDAMYVRMQTFATAGKTLSAEYIKRDGTWTATTISDDGTLGLTQHGIIKHNARGNLRSTALKATDWVPGFVDPSGLNLGDVTGDATADLYWLRIGIDSTAASIQINEIECIICSGYNLADGVRVRVRTPLTNITIRNLRILSKVTTTPLVFSRCHDVLLDNVHVFGGGPYSLAIYNCENFTVRGGSFRGDRADDLLDSGGTTYGIGPGGACRNLLIDGVEFQRYRHPIVGVAAASPEGVPRFIKIVNCQFNNVRGWGINGHGNLEYVTISNCDFVNGFSNLLDTDTNYKRAIQPTGSYWKILNCNFSGHRYGVSHIWGSYLLVADCTFEGNYTAVAIGGYNMRGFHIHDNEINNGSQIISIYGDAEDLNIHDNRFERFSVAGIAVLETGYNVRNLLIDANTFNDNTGFSSSNPIWSDTGSSISYLKIVNNVFKKVYAGQIVELSGTIVQPYLHGNTYKSCSYTIEKSVDWFTSFIRIPDVGFGMTVNTGDSYDLHDQVMLGATYDEATTFVSDRIVAYPPPGFDLKGCTLYTEVTADGVFDFEIRNATGTNQELVWGWWMFRLVKAYE